MISGLLQKTLRETWKQTLLFGLALLIVEALLTAVLPTLQKGLNEFLVTLPFIRTFLQALLGSDLGGNITAQMLQAIVWIHPVVLAIVWAQEIVFCTRVPAGEIDRGTIDVLLSWPASRRRILLCEAAVWLASGVLLVTMGFAGHCLAALSVRAEAESAGVAGSLSPFQSVLCVHSRRRPGVFLLGNERPPWARNGGCFCRRVGVVSAELRSANLASRRAVSATGHPQLLPAGPDSGHWQRAVGQHGVARRRGCDPLARGV